MKIEPVASAARREGVLRRNTCRVLVLANALAASTVWLLATDARAQVQIDIPNPGDISGVKNLSVVEGHFGTIGTVNLTANGHLEAGSAHVVGGLTVNGNTRFGNHPSDQHEFIGNTTLGVGNGSTATQIGLDFADTLTVNATSTFNAPVTINSTLTTSGKATLNSLDVTNNVVVGGTLNMTGGDITNVGTLNSATIANTGNIATSTLTTSGKATLNSLDVANNVVVGGALDTGGNLNVGATLSVTDDINVVNGKLNMTGGDITDVGTITASTGNIATVNSTTIVNSGDIKTKTLAVDEDASVGGHLTVAKGATVAESFTVTPGSTIDMGGNRVQNVADPIALTDAANKGYVDAGLARAFRDIDRNTEGVALAMAMAGTPTLLPMENFALTANWGQFEGAHGLAAGFAVRLDQNIQLNGGVAYGPSESTVGTRAGIRIGW